MLLKLQWLTDIFDWLHHNWERTHVQRKVALVIFCLWRPLGAIWGSVLFGALMILYLRLVIAFIPTQLYKILPYVVTVIVLIISSMRNNKEKQPPASLGLNYFREER